MVVASLKARCSTWSQWTRCFAVDCVMLKRWTLGWTVLLLIGQFSIQHNQAQEPMANDSDKEILTEKAKYFILNHIHFSDDVEEEQSDADEESGHNSENVTQSVNQGQCVSKNRLHLFQDIILKRLDNFTSLDESDQEERESEPSPSKLEYQRPVCKKGEGCDIPLDCYNFVTNGPHDIVPDPPRTVELTPLQLQSLLANGTYKNCCVLVMFYAPWCEYSVNFAQKFNAIGRTFLNLPVVSIDLSAHDPHKFVLAYLPVVAFYHWGKVVYKFNLEDSYEEMVDQLVKMTEFNATLVDIEDEENHHPVPIEREKADRFYLRLAVGWLIFVVLMTILKSKPVVDFVQYLNSRFHKPPPVVLAEDHERDD